MGSFDLISMADAVAGSASPQAAWEAFARYLAQEGIGRAQLQLDRPRDASNPFAAHPGARSLGTFWDVGLDAKLRSYEGDIRRARQREFLHIRPTLMFLSRFRTGFFMDHRRMIETASRSPFAPICRIMLEEMGQHHALVLPLADPSAGTFSCLALWTDERRPDFGAFVGARSVSLQMAGLHLRALIGLKWPTDSLPEADARLSDRQREVLALLAGGAQVAEIADRLAITERSVQEYLLRARVALGARTRTEAVALALTRGLL